MATYVCSDLHGHLELYEQIKDYIQPEDKVFYLGDAGDRGPQCWETIKMIYNDPQFIYIKGNHEDMLVGAMQDYLRPSRRMSEDYHILVRNGGLRTFDGWDEEENKEEWMEKLRELPTFATYQNDQDQLIYLTHAGFTPYWNESKKDTYLPLDEELLWDRYHFLDSWDEEHFPNIIVIHGHTPSHYIHREQGYTLDNYELGAYRYCDNHKICVDCGTYATKTVCLLNMDTWESKLFKAQEI